MYAAHESSIEAVKNNAELVRYVNGFGRDGDMGVVAIGKQRSLGAAWVRLWAGAEKGYGYVSDDVPELAIATHPDYRNQGIGSHLLQELLSLAKPHFPAISLSIRADNPALRLYERTGFIAVPDSETTNREGGKSFNMIYPFT